MLDEWQMLDGCIVAAAACRFIAGAIWRGPVMGI